MSTRPATAADPSVKEAVITPDATPQWFSDALAEVPEHRDTMVEGCRIRLRCWGIRGRPGLVLIHGGAAHSGWWDHVAPLLARTHRVVAVDLSGHGDSGWRPTYDTTQWAREVLAAAEAGDLAAPFTVAGHSMGGWVAATAGTLHRGQVDSVVIIDSTLNDRPPEEDRLRRRRRPTRIYPAREQILARFTSLPEQDVVLPYPRAHIAAQSVRRVEGGWTWKFHPLMFGTRPSVRDLLPQLYCQVAFIRCEFGLVPMPMAREIDRLLGHRAAIIELPAAGHHPMLDQPLALATALRTLLVAWATIERVGPA